MKVFQEASGIKVCGKVQQTVSFRPAGSAVQDSAAALDTRQHRNCDIPHA
ncbi:hypothetical protein [Deinococcus ruber]|nr:hypothetical protein [Deinococcus ruber]